MLLFHWNVRSVHELLSVFLRPDCHLLVIVNKSCLFADFEIDRLHVSLETFVDVASSGHSAYGLIDPLHGVRRDGDYVERSPGPKAFKRQGMGDCCCREGLHGQ